MPGLCECSAVVSQPEPQSIPPEAYDRDYFLSPVCEGLDEYRAGGVSFNKSKHLDLLGVRAGMRVLDAGCGRGEVLLACAHAGAEVAGIDYSESAVGLTRETLADYPTADIRVGSVTELPWPDETFDRIEYSDVIEHLDPPQMVPAFRESAACFARGGCSLPTRRRIGSSASTGGRSSARRSGSSATVTSPRRSTTGSSSATPITRTSSAWAS